MVIGLPVLLTQQTTVATSGVSKLSEGDLECETLLLKPYLS